MGVWDYIKDWLQWYKVHTISFKTFFVWAFKIIVDFWKFSMLLLYILWDDWLIFMISASNEQLQQQLEYTLLKPDCHTWSISKMQSDTLEEGYAIKFCFKLEKKMPRKRMECFRLLFDHLPWIEHQFLSGIRDSRKAGSLWGMIWGVGGVRKSIHQSWLAKRLGLLCWCFKEVQEEIPLEEIPSEGASTFKSGQWHFRQDNAPLHNSIVVPDYLTKMGIKILPHCLYSSDLAPCDFWLLPKLRGCRYETIEEMKEAVTKVIEVVGTVQQVHCCQRWLLRKGLELHVCTFNKSAHTKKVWKLIVCTSYVNLSRFISWFISCLKVRELCSWYIYIYILHCCLFRGFFFAHGPIEYK